MEGLLAAEVLMLVLKTLMLEGLLSWLDGRMVDGLLLLLKMNMTTLKIDLEQSQSKYIAGAPDIILVSQCGLHK